MDYPRRSRRPRTCFICCAVFVALIIVIAAVLAALFLTVYKVRDPTMRINSLSVENPSFGGGSLLPTNMVATTDASVKNPNILALHYRNPNITVYYHDQIVGHSVAPPGVAPARGTVTMKTKLNLNITKLLVDPRFVDAFTKQGLIELNTTVYVGGKVEILSVSHHVDVVFNCTLTVDVTTLSLKNQTCWQHMWF